MRSRQSRVLVLVLGMFPSVWAIPGTASAVEGLPTIVAATDLPQAGQPRLSTLKVLIGGIPAVVEVAISPIEQTTGMMFRTELGENEGMLFVFGEPTQASFWMMNCSLPLSVAYISPDATILEIYPLVPHDTSSVKSISHNVKYAIEMSRDWFQNNNVHTGMKVSAVNAPLEELFHGTQ